MTEASKNSQFKPFLRAFVRSQSELEGNLSAKRSIVRHADSIRIAFHFINFCFVGAFRQLLRMVFKFAFRFRRKALSSLRKRLFRYLTHPRRLPQGLSAITAEACSVESPGEATLKNRIPDWESARIMRGGAKCAERAHEKIQCS